MALPWYRRPEQLEQFRCRECGRIHCAWCGISVTPHRKVTFPLSPTKEHLLPRHERNGHQVPGRDIILAHRVCNHYRGHANWPRTCTPLKVNDARSRTLAPAHLRAVQEVHRSLRE